MPSISIEELLKEFNGDILPKLQQTPSEVNRFLLFLAWLNTKLEQSQLGRMVVVGGFAAEFYTGATYRTLDVDLVVEGSNARQILTEFLSKISEKPCRIYLPTFEAIASKGIDIVAESYSKPKPPVKIEVEEYSVYMESPEELIITYLNAWKYWQSSEDRDKALALIAVLWSKVDQSYVKQRAKEESVHDKLEEALKILEEA